MKGSKYEDIPAVTQVIGCVLANPDILRNSGNYVLRNEDFTKDIHRIIFGATYNLAQKGSTEVSPITIDIYLEENSVNSYAIYMSSNGSKLVAEWKENADPDNFEYYYSRVKKMTLLRSYEKAGMNLDWLYNPDIYIEDRKKSAEQEERLNRMTLSEIANEIDERMREVRTAYVDNSERGEVLVGDGLKEYYDSLQLSPAVGYPMYGRFVNTVYRGARLGKFYLRSASTGTGKSRSMLADACYFSCGEIYDTVERRWVSTGMPKMPTYFISVELDVQELQTMAIAFLSGVNESKILNRHSSQPTFDEQARIDKAIEILSNSPLYMSYLPDYRLQDIENIIKRGMYRHNCKLFVLDYIATSMGIIEEISTRSSGMKLREDNVLFLLSTKLKDMCSQYDIFVLSGTQLNGSYKTDDTPDQNLLRGSKAIADRVDIGTIMLDCTASDLEKVKPIYEAKGFPPPNVKMSVYKNRGGKDTRIFLWMLADKGTCRYDTLFATNYSYEWYDINDMRITIDPETGEVESNEAV